MARALGCLRYLLIAGTAVLGISGIIVAISAGYFIYQLYEYKQLTPDDVTGPSILLLALGFLACSVGWLSWHFLDFTHKGQVIIFATSLALISLLETGAGIWALVRYEQIDSLPGTHLEKVFAAASTKENKPLWDHIQIKFRCCGVDGPSDYRGQNSVPWSCCDTTESVQSNTDKAACTTMYARGCHHVMMSRTRSILLHAFLLALCSVLLKICLIVASTCYVRAISDRIEKRVQESLARRISSVESSNPPENGAKLLHRQSSYADT
ncbi:hypothetical protein KPH14_005683 [Odynerus spinipes]|uniref:Tetraspanin n=1 Tax=Odynerus spinipes TaxID=1348599 RepID=A0AAD9RAU4_9HYME|nr:hypothetical protein KPH14_005683 [Odynerus spinipes]